MPFALDEGVDDPKGPEKPRLGQMDVTITLLARFLTVLRFWVVVWTVLMLCAVAYAVAWTFGL